MQYSFFNNQRGTVMYSYNKMENFGCEMTNMKWKCCVKDGRRRKLAICLPVTSGLKTTIL